MMVINYLSILISTTTTTTTATAASAATTTTTTTELGFCLQDFIKIVRQFWQLRALMG